MIVLKSARAQHLPHALSSLAASRSLTFWDQRVLHPIVSPSVHPSTADYKVPGFMSIPGIEPRKEAKRRERGRRELWTFLFFRLCSRLFLFFLVFYFAPHGTAHTVVARLGYRENPINQVRAGAHEMDISASVQACERASARGVTLLARVATRRRACEHAGERFMRREYFIPMAIETTPG